MQNKSSTRFLILSILVMVILAVTASTLFTELYNSTSNTNIAYAAVTSSNFSAGYNEEVSAELDGNVPANYSTDLSNATAVSTKAELATALHGGTANYYLSANIVWDESFTEYATSFSGKLDGCGHTILISGSYLSSSTTSTSSWGALTGYLSGTIKNVKFVIASAEASFSAKEKGTICVGGLFGGIGGSAKLINCYILYQNSANLYYTNRSDRNGGTLAAGVISGFANGGASLTNVTLDIQSEYCNTFAQDSWTNHNGDHTVCVGGFFGWSDTGTVQLTDCTIKGDGSFQVYNLKDNSNSASSDNNDGDAKGYYGLIFGAIDETMSVVRFVNDYAGVINGYHFSNGYNIGTYYGKCDGTTPSVNVVSSNPNADLNVGWEDGYIAGSYNDAGENSLAYIQEQGYSNVNSGWTAITNSNFASKVIGATSGFFYLTEDIVISSALTTKQTSTFNVK